MTYPASLRTVYTILLLACTTFAQVSVLPPTAKFRQFTAAGAPAIGWKLCTYAAGTTTPQSTFTDSTGGTPNANPVTMDSSGYANVWINPALGYKFVMQDSTGTSGTCNGAIQWTVDNINTPVPSFPSIMNVDAVTHTVTGNNDTAFHQLASYSISATRFNTVGKMFSFTLDGDFRTNSHNAQIALCVNSGVGCNYFPLIIFATGDNFFRNFRMQGECWTISTGVGGTMTCITTVAMCSLGTGCNLDNTVTVTGTGTLEVVDTTSTTAIQIYAEFNVADVNNTADQFAFITTAVN